MTHRHRKTLLCQYEGRALCIYHCLMSIIAQQMNSPSWQHNYIFTLLVAVLALQVCAHVCVLVYVFRLTALHSALTSRCFQSPLPSHAWWTRDKCQRVNMSTATCLFPEWLHLACATCHSQWKRTHLCTHTCRHIANEFNPEIHTSPREPRAVLSGYVNYCMQCALKRL